MDSSPNSPTGGSSKSNLQLPNRGSVVIFGAGIAGLSAAHEAVDMGFDVTVYESQPGPGGQPSLAARRSSVHQVH
jgi:glycine/D-amino acid oxidase-like deaminating enzyme